MRTKIIGIVCLFFLLSGCRLSLANYARDEMFPQGTTAKVAMSPLLLPTYMLFSVIDVAIINPVDGANNVPEAVSSLWGWQNETAWIGLGALLPVKLAATPLWVVGVTMFSEQFAKTEGPQRINRPK